MKQVSFLIAIVVAAIFVRPRPSVAQTSYPMIMSLKPVAAQVGQTSIHTISSRYSMAGTYQVIVSGDGVTGTAELPKTKPGEKTPDLTSLKLHFKVAPDATPGIRDFRVATPRGVSTVGQLVVVRDSVTSESGNNDKRDQANAISVPGTIYGAIEKSEDVDFYKFQVKAGTSLNFHVRSMRLQNRIHDLQKHSDPIITLRNSAGSTLAASDNYFFGDPFLSYRFEYDGEYSLEIRDVRYQGNRYWEYCIEISDRPFICNVFPIGIARGTQSRFDLIGFQLPQPTATVSIPKELQLGPQSIRLPIAGQLSNPVPVVVTDLAVTTESIAENNSVSTSQVVAIPAAINGRIEQEYDIDCYTFEAKKGEHLSFEVVARRQQSALDSHLRILNDKNKQFTTNDDLKFGKRSFADSWIENWNVPSDGKYTIEIGDVHLRGGANFVYFLKITRSEPYFELFADTAKTQLTPGTDGVVFVRVVRKNGFEGEIELIVEGLPAKVTAHCGRILAKGQDGCIILASQSDQPLAVSEIRIRGRATHIPNDGPPRELETTAVTYQETYQPGGGRGHWPVHSHVVSIGASSDLLAVNLNTTDVTLKPGESKRIDITIERADGFNKNVTLDMLYRHLSSVYGNSLPDGVTIDSNQSVTLLTGTKIKGHITLKAAENAAPVEKQQVAVMANVSINFVMKATYSSSPLLVTVLEK